MPNRIPDPQRLLRRLRRRPARWGRRTGYVARQTLADLGVGTGRAPAWLRDNPFLVKTSRTETRRLGLLGRLLTTVLLLGGLLVGGLWLEDAYPPVAVGIARFLLGTTLPGALLVVLSFVHVALIGNARTALAVSLADEARRGTLPDLLLTPLRRAEMLLAMGVGPARTALLVAGAGLPVYGLLAQLGGLTGRDLAFLCLLLALLCYAPPVWAFPGPASAALTPETFLGRFAQSRARRPPRPNAVALAGIYVFLSVFFVGQALGVVRGGWLGHLLGALHQRPGPSTSFFLVFAWPAQALRLLGDRLPFFHADLSPLWYVLPLLLLNWASSALASAAALSAEDAAGLARLPLGVRARTLARWTARAAGLCALGLVWRAWVESGDTATLAGGPALGSPGWNAAGLLLLLGGGSLPNICARALGEPVDPTPATSRDPSLGGKGAGGLGRRALRRSLRPLGVALGTFLLACLLGGLSPFAPPVYQTAGRIALAGAVTVLWGVGVRRALGRGDSPEAKWLPYALLYGLPLAALSLPGAGLLASLSPASAWVGLFPDAPGLLGRFPLWTVAAPPPFAVCLAGSALAGALGVMAVAGRRGLGRRGGEGTSPRPSPPRGEGVGIEGDASGSSAALSSLPPSPSEGEGRGEVPSPKRRGEVLSVPRHAAWTAALLGWVTARTDNPLLTYELRTRTRSGRWADWLVFAPLLLGAGLIGTAAYPEVVAGLAFLSPFHFFGSSGAPPSPQMARAELASLLLAGQCWMLGFRGQLLGEALIARDRQRGLWGFILLTPLPSGAIFWGKVCGQATGAAAAWTLCGAASLILYALAAPAVGLGPALAAWAAGQALVAALFALGVGLGSVLSPYPVFSKSLRGAAGLLFAALVGLGVWGQFQVIPLNTPAFGPDGWRLLATRLWLGSAAAAALALPLLWLGSRQIAALRARDVAFGDGTE